MIDWALALVIGLIKLPTRLVQLSQRKPALEPAGVAPEPHRLSIHDC